MPRRATGPLLVLAAAALWGTTGTAQALGPDGITPGTVAAVRMVGGATLLGYAYRRGQWAPIRSLMRPALVAAIAAMAASQPLFFTGVARTGVAVGTIVTIGSGPILAGLLGWVVRRERVGRRWLIATALSVAGAVSLVSGGTGAGVDAGGVGFALGAGLAWAVYLVAAKSLFADLPPIFVVAIVFAAAAIVLAPWFVASHPAWVLTGRGAVVAAWFVVTTALSYVLFATGLTGTSVATAATLSLSEPLTAAILGMTVLGEPALFTTIAGIGLIAIGLFVISGEQPVEPVVE
jgi:DME family drug/metabolite transporter